MSRKKTRRRRGLAGLGGLQKTTNATVGTAVTLAAGGASIGLIKSI